MRAYIFIVIFLSGFFDSKAQNYNCFTPGITRYFINAEGYVRGMRIDSITGSGNNFVYHPYRTPRGEYSVAFVVPPTLDSAGGSWLGKKVYKRPDGTFLFDNIFDDTIVVKTQCQPGDSWIFYNDTSSIYYTAICIEVDSMTVLGLLDSVKKIRVSCTDTLDEMHGKEILLSKSHGFVQVFDFYTFPYHEPGNVYQPGWDMFLDVCGSSSFTLFDFQPPTYTQLTDWNVGDVFFRYSNLTLQGPLLGEWYLDTIIGKVLDSSGVHYYTTGVKWVPDITIGINTKSPRNDSIFCPNQPLLAKLPEEAVPGGQTHLLRFIAQDTSCYVSPVYERHEIPVYYDQPFWMTTTIPFTRYKTGIGETYYYYYRISDDSDNERRLVYSKHNGIECGLDDMQTILSLIEPNSVAQARRNLDVDIYPNPANEAVCIKLPGSKFDVACYDALGKEVVSRTGENKAIIPTVSLHPGVYHLVIRTGEGDVFTKKLLIQR